MQHDCPPTWAWLRCIAHRVMLLRVWKKVILFNRPVWSVIGYTPLITLQCMNTNKIHGIYFYLSACLASMGDFHFWLINLFLSLHTKLIDPSATHLSVINTWQYVMENPHYNKACGLQPRSYNQNKWNQINFQVDNVPTM